MKSLGRQVLHLESSVEVITSRLEFIMEKLVLQDKGNEAAGKLTVTNHVSMELSYTLYWLLHVEKFNILYLSIHTFIPIP